MAEQNFPDNILYEMDNLDVLRGMNSATVDLIATDPPFNTGRNRSGTAGLYVDNWRWGDTGILPDQWKWNEVHPIWLDQIKDDNRALFEVIEAAGHAHGGDIAAFLCFLSVRLLECHRILKPTGSIYLHCDHTANAYIRMCMDAIFGAKNFRNEIVWQTTGKTLGAKQFPRTHDTIFWYSKGKKWTWNPPLEEPTEQYLSTYTKEDEYGRYNTTDLSGGKKGGPAAYKPFRGKLPPQGRGWAPPTRDKFPEALQSKLSSDYERLDVLAKCYALDDAGLIFWTKNGKPRYKKYLGTTKGKLSGDVITNISYAKRSERTGSPDQKPLALYERIILASSNEGDLVLDPFAGCATTIIAAHKHKRRWVGIDRRLDARFHVVCRLMGISAKDAAKIRDERPDLNDWLNSQLAKYDAHYSVNAPERNDAGETAAPALAPVFTINDRPKMTHKEMRGILIEQFGLQCWGCDFEAPDERYLELDHVTPKSDGGSNDLDNRALLCRPCNGLKSNRQTMTKLRSDNFKSGYLSTRNHPINLQVTGAWCRQRLALERDSSLRQLNLAGA